MTSEAVTLKIGMDDVLVYSSKFHDYNFRGCGENRDNVDKVGCALPCERVLDYFVDF